MSDPPRHAGSRLCEPDSNYDSALRPPTRIRPFGFPVAGSQGRWFRPGQGGAGLTLYRWAGVCVIPDRQRTRAREIQQERRRQARNVASRCRTCDGAGGTGALSLNTGTGRAGREDGIDYYSAREVTFKPDDLKKIENLEALSNARRAINLTFCATAPGRESTSSRKESPYWPVAERLPR